VFETIEIFDSIYVEEKVEEKKKVKVLSTYMKDKHRKSGL